jgi:hypothetical protein
MLYSRNVFDVEMGGGYSADLLTGLGFSLCFFGFRQVYVLRLGFLNKVLGVVKKSFVLKTLYKLAFLNYLFSPFNGLACSIDIVYTFSCCGHHRRGTSLCL